MPASAVRDLGAQLGRSSIGSLHQKSGRCFTRRANRPLLANAAATPADLISRSQRLLPAVPLFSTDKPTNWLIPWRLSSNSMLPCNGWHDAFDKRRETRQRNVDLVLRLSREV